MKKLGSNVSVKVSQVNKKEKKTGKKPKGRYTICCGQEKDRHILNRKIQAKYYWQSALNSKDSENEMKTNISKKLLKGLDES